MIHNKFKNNNNKEIKDLKIYNYKIKIVARLIRKS